MRKKHPQVRLLDGQTFPFPLGLELSRGNEVHDLVSGHIQDFGYLFQTDTHSVSKLDQEFG
jgi:hypothetical protein